MVRVLVFLVLLTSSITTCAPVPLDKRCWGDCMTKNNNSTKNWSSVFTNASTSNWNKV